MAWQRFHNRTNFPVNLCFTNAGIIYPDADKGVKMYRNNVKKYDEIFTPGVGYDLHVFYSTDQTTIDPDKWNPGAILNVVSISVGIAAVVVGIVAIPLTAGASGTLAAVGMGLAIGGGVAGGVATIGGAVASALGASYNVGGLYGANDHNFYLDGGIEGKVKDDGTIEVTKVKPLTISYLNCQTGEKVENGGYKIP